MLTRLEVYGEAISHLQSALKIKPAYLDALCNSANLYFAKGMWLQAADLYQSVLDLDAGHSVAKINLGAVFLYLGRVTDAMPLLEEAVCKTPSITSSVGIWHLPWKVLVIFRRLARR